MKNLRRPLVLTVVMAFMFMLVGSIAFAQEKQPMTLEKAATAERVKKQKEQIPTHEKRKVAADSLKTERQKLYKAKQDAGLVEDEKAKKHNAHDKTQ